jgi:hypothetical protein
MTETTGQVLSNKKPIKVINEFCKLLCIRQLTHTFKEKNYQWPSLSISTALLSSRSGDHILLLLLLLLLLTAIDLSVDGSSPYTSTDKTKNKYT